MMKKLFCCFCVLLLILSVFAGCGADKPETDAGSTGESASVSAPSETAPSTTEAPVVGLAFEMREENFEHKTSAGELYSTNQISYPYFLGSSALETQINGRYADMIERYRNDPEEDVDAMYRNMEELGELERLPLYENIEATVTYNENGYLSILEWSHLWAGGMHPYHYEGGLNYDVKTAAQLAYFSFFRGGKAAADRYLTALGEAEGVGRDGWFEDSQFVLTEEGLRFYVWHGDAVARQELLIPYTEGAAPFVAPEAVPASAAQQSLSDEEIKALFIKANDLYIGWLSNIYSWDYHLRLTDGNWIFTDSFGGSMDLYFHPDMPWTD